MFELQNLRLKEHKLEMDMKNSQSEFEKSVEKLNEKRAKKVSDLNRLRNQLHTDKNMIELKARMSQLNMVELDLDNQIKECETLIDEDMDVINSLNTELRIKKMYSLSDNQTLEEIVEAETQTIERAIRELEEVKMSKQQSYVLINSEFEKARVQLIAEMEAASAEFVQLKLEIAQSMQKELELKSFLNNCLYENDEEKCLVENELTELIETREALEEGRLEELRQLHQRLIDDHMKKEYQALDELKQQDQAEIDQDEDRIQVLRESTIKNVQDSIKFNEHNMKNRQIELRNLQEMAVIHNKKMGFLMNQVIILICVLFLFF